MRTALGKQQGISEDLVAHLATYHDGPFSPRKKAALRLAELLALDLHRLDKAPTDKFEAQYLAGYASLVEM